MRKTLYVIASANGSGKTTFALNFAELENLKFINADEIAKQYDPNDIQKYKVKAGKKFFEELELSLTENNSFFNGDDNFELVENQNETFDEDSKRIFLEGFIDG